MYLDFVETEPFTRIAKQNPKSETDLRRYVSITCPHCADQFVEITVDNLSTNKASECKKHLLRCKSASVGRVCPEPTTEHEHRGYYTRPRIDVRTMLRAACNPVARLPSTVSFPPCLSG